MKSIIISIFVCVFILASGFNAIGEEWSAEQKEVWLAIEQYNRYIENGDVASAMALIHENALDLYSDNPSPLNIDQINSSNVRLSSMKPTIEIKPISIAIMSTNLAIAFYYFKWKSKDGVYSSKDRTMQTFIKQDDKWISIGSFSSSCNKPSPCAYGW